MFEIGNRVKIVDGNYAGKLGMITKIFPAGTMAEDDVFMVKYQYSGNSGMFEAGELVLTDAE